jgi:hypothetical protein
MDFFYVQQFLTVPNVPNVPNPRHIYVSAWNSFFRNRSVERFGRESLWRVFSKERIFNSGVMRKDF